MKVLKEIWDGFVHAWVTFFGQVWKFVFDLFTDKQGNWDEKRVVGFGLIVIGILSGLKLLGSTVDIAFAYFLVTTGITLYFGAGVLDGIVPQVKPGSFSVSQVFTPGVVEGAAVSALSAIPTDDPAGAGNGGK